MALLASSVALAQSTTNSIFIEQVGDGSNINITQKGQSNKVGTEQNRVVLEGNNQTITATQEGNNNSYQMPYQQPLTQSQTVYNVGGKMIICHQMGNMVHCM